MSFSFHNNPAERVIDAIRTELGDTVDETHLIEDEMIKYCLQQTDNDTLRAAAQAAELTAAKFAREETVSTNGITVDKSAAQNHLLLLAKTLRQRVPSEEAFIVNAQNAAQFAANAKDPTSTHPAFRRGMFSRSFPGSLSGDPETE